MPPVRRSTRIATSRQSPYNYGPPPRRSIVSDVYFYAPPNAEYSKCVKNSTKSDQTASPVIPQAITTLKFSFKKWKSHKKPTNFHGPWPPTSTAQLMTTGLDLPSLGSSRKQTNFLRQYGSPIKEDCLGKYCWQTPNWTSPYLCARDFDPRERCEHTFSEWKTGFADWASRFEIREAPGMGYGLFSKQVRKKGDVLGVYIGELIPERTQDTDYCHQVHIGPQFSGLYTPVAYVDAREYGNYTRFCNHSCENNAVVTEARVGGERVLALRVVRGIGVGEQVLVDYGEDYFRERRCCCGSKRCRYAKVDDVVDRV